MPIVMTLSAELRVSVPTVGGIQLVTFQEVGIQKTTPIVMEYVSNWLILTLEKGSISPSAAMCGVLGEMGNCCSYSPQESP
jgi:hypothetical protein